MKWKRTPEIKMGCNKNWTKGFVPIKWESILKSDSLKTDVILIRKCWSKKTIKKMADIAIESFLPIDDLKNLFI